MNSPWETCAYQLNACGAFEEWSISDHSPPRNNHTRALISRYHQLYISLDVSPSFRLLLFELHSEDHDFPRCVAPGNAQLGSFFDNLSTGLHAFLRSGHRILRMMRSSRLVDAEAASSALLSMRNAL